VEACGLYGGLKTMLRGLARSFVEVMEPLCRALKRLGFQLEGAFGSPARFLPVSLPHI